MSTTADTPTPGCPTPGDALTAADRSGGTVTFAIPTNDPGSGVSAIQLIPTLLPVSAAVTTDAGGELTAAGVPDVAVTDG
jgi:hypothetical protein